MRIRQLRTLEYPKLGNFQLLLELSPIKRGIATCSENIIQFVQNKTYLGAVVLC